MSAIPTCPRCGASLHFKREVSAEDYGLSLTRKLFGCDQCDYETCTESAQLDSDKPTVLPKRGKRKNVERLSA